MREFSARLRTYRTRAALTQEQLAELAGLSARGVQDLERGLYTPRKSTLALLVEALHLTGDERRAFENAATSRSRAQARRHSTLPAELSSFIGREQELEAVQRSLPSTRLLTLTGPGGTGKTRLALAAAAELLSQFDDGVVFVSLAFIRDPDFVLPTLAAELGLRELGRRPLREVLRDYLHDKVLLLVLDNFEQVLDAAPLVTELLAGSAGLKVLATSRAVLRVTGEHEFPVAPLAVPRPARALSLSELQQISAVRLFVERATAARPDFALTPENAGAVAEVCRRLDGLPLALELAAARVRVLPPQALVRQLATGPTTLQLLTGATRDMPSRQQTLRATMDWSYDLLSPREQAVFRCLSVFVGGCTSTDVEEVLRRLEVSLVTHDDELELLRHIESLVSQSLLMQLDSGEPRFHMLETVREYAAERLSRCGEEVAAQQAHAAHYLAKAEAAEPRLAGPEAGTWINRLEADHDNIRAALRWALDHSDSNTAVRLSGAVWRFWHMHGHLREGSRWLDEALATRGPYSSTDDPSGSTSRSGTPPAGKALTGAGVLAHYQGAYTRGAALCAESLALCRGLGDPAGSAAALEGLAFVARAQGNYAAARAMFQEACDIRDALGDAWGSSQALRYLATVMWLEEDYVAARPLIQRALDLSNVLRDPRGVSSALHLLSCISLSLGDFSAAETQALQALSLVQGIGDRGDRTARAFWALGRASAAQGRHDDGLAQYQTALSISWEIGDEWFAVFSLSGLAETAAACGHLREAARLLAAQSKLLAVTGAPLPPTLHPEFERTRSAARAKLDATAFASAWAAGQALSLEEALDEALALDG